MLCGARYAISDCHGINVHVYDRSNPIIRTSVGYHNNKPAKHIGSSTLSPSHTGSYDFLIVRLVAIWSAMTDRQCLPRSPFTIARSGVFCTIGCRACANLHDNLCIYTFWQVYCK